VLVLPLRRPVVAAKQLATIDALSGGRLVLGIGAGWLEAEFDACGVPFRSRGDLTDEAVDVLRACWTEAPTSFEGPTVRFRHLKVKPLPARPIPIWVGGTGTRALCRAVQKGDGWQGVGVPLRQLANPDRRRYVTLDDLSATIKRLREDRPEPGFAISMRLDVDGLTGDLGEFRRHLDAYTEAGVDHVLSSPAQRTLDEWLASVEALWDVFKEYAT
jgi:probable F420-dependent oxidoreductase